MPDKRIEELTKKLEIAEAAEDRARLCHAFWGNVKEEKKSPFIEEMPNGNYKVTFLYQNETEGLNVLLDCVDLRERLMDAEGHARQFTQIPGTDIYVLELDDIPADTCIPYEFEVNGGRSFKDENNSKDFRLPSYNMRERQTELPARVSSILTLPEAQADEQVWSRGLSQEKGSVESRKLKDESGRFGERTCWVYKPHHFNASSEQKHKLLLVLDGEAYIPYLPPYLDSHPDELANVVVAFVGHRIGLESNEEIEANRKFEYITQGPAFADYLVEDVLTELRQDPSLRVSSNSQDTFLAGFSMAGYCAAEVGLDHSDEIAHVILLSPALNNNQAGIVQRYAETPTRENLRVYQSVGKLEDRMPDARSEEEGLTKEDRVTVNRRFQEVLQQKGYESTYVEPAIGHTELMSIPFLAHSLHQVLREEKKCKLSDECYFLVEDTEDASKKKVRFFYEGKVESTPENLMLVVFHPDSEMPIEIPMKYDSETDQYQAEMETSDICEMFLITKAKEVGNRGNPQAEVLQKGFLALKEGVLQPVNKDPTISEGKLENFLLKNNGDLVKTEVTDETSLEEGDRFVKIYFPPGYDPNKKPAYPLQLTLDGGQYLNPMQMNVTMDNLIAKGEMEPAVVVFISPQSGPLDPDKKGFGIVMPPGYSLSMRLKEYSCNPDFADKLANLSDKMREQFNVSKSREDMTIWGVSAGGLQAIYTGLLHPETFGNVVAESPMSWNVPTQNGPNWRDGIHDLWNDHGVDISWSTSTALLSEVESEHNEYVTQMLQSERDEISGRVLNKDQKIKFYLDAGSREAEYDPRPEVGSANLLEGARVFAAAAMAAGHTVVDDCVHVIPDGGHHNMTWMRNQPAIIRSMHGSEVKLEAANKLKGELFELFKADQLERTGRQAIRIDPEVEKARRDRVVFLLSEMEKSPALPNKKDYYYAAVLFSHGSSHEDYQRAHEYAQKSLNKYLIAATYDRTQIEHDPPLPQKYGTQRYGGGDKVDELIEVLGSSINRAAMNEARHELGIMSLEEEEEKIINPSRAERGLPNLTIENNPRSDFKR